VILVSELRLDDSQAAAARGDLAQAADDARGASSVEPWSPEAPLQLALVEELQGDLDAARSAAGRAIDLAPGDWRGWAVAARIDDGRGDRGAAARERARARALTPVPLPAEFAAPRRP
jgi:tetratricopeptide (TPR) repeat protein